MIYYKTDALKATETGSDRISAQTTTVTNDTIADPDALIVWHIAPTDDGNWTIYNAEKNVYAASNGTMNKGKLISSVTENAKWSVEGTDTYEFTNVANKAKGVNALLRWNSTSIGWATYSGSTGGKVSLYKASGGTTYYTTLTTPAAAEVDGIAYETLQAAIAAADGSTVKLLQDAAAITVSGTVYLDLNGFTAEINADKLFVTDSSATTTAAGTGSLVTTGAVEQNYNGFVALAENGVYTFHALKLEITTVTLRTAKAGIYYKATLACDPALQAQIGAYGVTLRVEEGAAHSTRYVGAPTGEFTSGSVFNIFHTRYSAAENAARGEMDIYANAYVELLDGTVIADTAGTACSLRDIITYLDENFEELGGDEISAAVAFCATWREVVSKWELYELI